MVVLLLSWKLLSRFRGDSRVLHDRSGAIPQGAACGAEVARADARAKVIVAVGYLTFMKLSGRARARLILSTASVAVDVTRVGRRDA
jgi:hypothetical protein